MEVEMMVGTYDDGRHLRGVRADVRLEQRTLPTARPETNRPPQPTEALEFAISITSGRVRKSDRTFLTDRHEEIVDGGGSTDELALVIDFAAGWDANTRDRLAEIAKRWHLNGTNACCEHQRELGWQEKRIDESKPIRAYGRHFEGQQTDSWNMLGWVRPDEHPDGLLTKPCPVCGYLYGSAWVYEALPDDVVAFLVRQFPLLAQVS